MILTTKRNMRSIADGIDETGRAGEDLVAGQLVYYDPTHDEWKEAGVNQTGILGVVLNFLPPETDFKDDEHIVVRVLGVAVVDADAGIKAGDFVIPSANAKVKSAILKRDSDTIADTTTSIVCDHDLGITPSVGDIRIYPEDPTLGSATYMYVNTITATQFTINVDQDPGKDLVFNWEIRSEEYRVVGKAKGDTVTGECVINIL